MQNNQKENRAIIYCRVSSERQKNEGHGLDSQEHRCRQYAQSKGYAVDEVFRDSFTGGGDFMKRPAMSALLRFLDNHPHKQYVVIFDDLKRFARDKRFHWDLKAAFKSRNTPIECLNFRFDDTPEGEFVEAIFAAQGELEREQNRRQVIQKQKARLERGYWPFYPPPGYTQVKDPLHGKILKPVEPQATLIREAFEGFATDRFQTITDTMNFLREAGYSKRPMYVEGVRRMLRRVVYAGYVEREEWEVSRRKAQHEAIVSFETFEKVQSKLDGKYKVRVRISDRLDFVLRGFLLCAFCNENMTGSWSRGRSKMYRFYRCKTSSCVRYNKSVNADFVDAEFEKLLQSVVPKQEALALAKVIALDVWKDKIKGLENQQVRLEKGLQETRRQIEVLSARVARAMDERLVDVYEQQILGARNEAEVLQEKLKNLGVSTVDFGTAFEGVLSFLENPLFIWAEKNINAKRLVMRLVFAEKLAFHPELGFETAQKSLLIGLFEQFSTKKSQDVEVRRVELRSESGYESESTTHSRH